MSTVHASMRRAASGFPAAAFIACLLVSAGARAAAPASFEERLATFRESPAEEAAKQVVLKRYQLQVTGKPLEAMQYLSEDFTEHMTPKRMPQDGRTAYQRFKERAERAAKEPPRIDAKSANYPYQARASEDLVTLFHAYGCDIFRVRNGKVTDHWDCTPWQPFSNPGELKQLQDMDAPAGTPAPAAAAPQEK